MVATEFCDERSMVRVLDESKRARIMTEMADKRAKAAELFGSPATGATTNATM